MEYAGADVGFFDRFRKDFSTLENGTDEKHFSEYSLLKNYRSTERIVRYAETFIAQVSRRIKSHPLRSHREEGEKVEVIRYNGKQLIYPACIHQ